MHVLTVCYGHPTDPAAFDSHYEAHPPAAHREDPRPGQLHRPPLHSLDGSQPPYYLLAELSFASREAMMAGLRSPEGRSAAADVPNFATGGVTMFVAHD